MFTMYPQPASPFRCPHPSSISSQSGLPSVPLTSHGLPCFVSLLAPFPLPESFSPMSSQHIPFLTTLQAQLNCHLLLGPYLCLWRHARDLEAHPLEKSCGLVFSHDSQTPCGFVLKSSVCICPAWGLQSAPSCSQPVSCWVLRGCVFPAWNGSWGPLEVKKRYEPRQIISISSVDCWMGERRGKGMISKFGQEWSNPPPSLHDYQPSL